MESGLAVGQLFSQNGPMLGVPFGVSFDNGSTIPISKTFIGSDLQFYRVAFTQLHVLSPQFLKQDDKEHLLFVNSSSSPVGSHCQKRFHLFTSPVEAVFSAVLSALQVQPVSTKREV